MACLGKTGDTAFLQKLIDALPFPVYYKDVNGVYLGGNRAFGEFLGRSVESIIGKTVHDVCPNALADDCHRADVELCRQGGVQVYESCMQHADGTRRDVLFRKAVFRGRGGKIGGLIAAIFDITNRKKTEENLRRSEERYRRIFENIQDVYYELDFDGTIQELSPSIEKRAPLKREQLIGRSIYEFYADKNRRKAFLKEIKAKGRVADFEIQLKDDQGSVVTCSITATILPGEGDRPPRIAGSLRDISERKRVESELKRKGAELATAKEFMEAIINGLHDMLAVIETERFTVVSANKAFLDALGLDKKAVVGQRCSKLAYNRSALCFSAANDDCPVAEAIKTGKPARRERMRPDRTGSERWYDVTVIPLRNSRGRGGIGRVINMARDITEHKRLEGAMRRQREELSQIGRLITMNEFVATLAHEINQPLAAIMNNAQAIQRLLSFAQPNIEGAKRILNNIIADDKRAGDVIRNIRMFMQRDEAGKSSLNINRIIQGVLTVLEYEIQEKKVSLHLDLSPHLPLVWGSAVGLQQVVLNIILNGCDAMMDRDPPERRLHIRTGVDDPDNILVTVQDSGTGLAEEGRERIFEPFYTTKPEGLGLGLSISRSIITDHGGRMWAVNNPAGGAAFSFSLPPHREGHE